MFWNPCQLYLKLQWLLELLPFLRIANVSLSFSSICDIVLPFLAPFPQLLCVMDMSHQLCGFLLSVCQQLRCLVCCAPVSGWSVQRSPTVSLHCHFLAHSLVCVHTTWLHVKIHVFYTLPNKQFHQLYHVGIGGTAFLQVFYILQPHDWLFHLFLCTINTVVRHSVCQFCSLRCLFSMLDLMQSLAFPLFLFLAILFLASSRFPGSPL